MKRKNIILLIFIASLLIIVSLLIKSKYLQILSEKNSPTTTTTSARFVSSTIYADGSITAQNQAVLHFQTGGKLTYLPFKEGDTVRNGQTIASLDTYTIQRQLQAALNTYRSARDSFDQLNDESQNGVEKAKLTNPYDYYAKAGLGVDTKENAINDAIKRIVDQNQANLDNSVINVQLANYAFQLSAITSPLNGIVLHEDVKVPGVNVTAATSFTVADPSTAVFRANITVSNINYIEVGSSAEIAIDGLESKIEGTVVNIYPQKITLPNGQSVYQVDIQSDELIKLAKLDQTGTAMIKTNSENVALVPAWTVLGGKYIWVNVEGKPQLKTVTTGKIHGGDIEITSGLTTEDKIIINPKFVSGLKYKIL
jgi:multidrug efflux pump subunit AcrA (membrane-fusion protein)